MPRSPLIAALLVTLVQPAFAQRDLADIPTPDPVEELKTFVVADGFEVNLFAADPLIHKPIQFNFDPQGRLWVAASEVYPQIAPGQTANDKILVLEDTDGDGVADKTTVFADGLLIPTGVIPGDGGAYVANSTELLHLADTDGDGKADKRRIVLSGFGTEDTHHIIHTFRWGPECLFYMNQSIYIHSHVETPYGVRRLNAGGIWQFRPETMRLDVLARGWVNTWGHVFDQWGQSFVTDGAGGEGINYLVPGAAYPTAYGVSEILHGLNPGSPKYCGLALVDGPHLPEDWQGNLITHDFRGHRVCRFIVEDEGSGYVSKQQPDLISSKHVAFRPIDVQQGPDGAIYVADWYNPIIQHGEVDFRDPRRDHVHGRIWRVTAKGRPLVARRDLPNLSTPELLKVLQSPESYARQQAKRVLKERGATAILPELTAWVEQLDPQDPRVEHHRLEGLWMFQAVDVVNHKLLAQVLASKDPHARAAAVRVVPHWADRVEQPHQLLASAVVDEFPRVRLEAVRALAAIGTLPAAELALAVIDRPRDAFLDYATRQSVRELKPVWLPALLEGRFRDEGHFNRILYAVQAAEAAEVIPAFVQRLESGQIPEAQRPQVMELIGALGAPAQLRLVLDRALSDKTPPAERIDLFRALIAAHQRRNVKPAGDLTAVIDLLSRSSGELTRLVAECLGRWSIPESVTALTAIARSDQAETSTRNVSLQALAALGGAKARETLVAVASHDPSEEISGKALQVLIPVDAAQAAALTVEWLGRSQLPDQQLAVTQAFLKTKGAPDVLAKALQGRQVPEDSAKICLRAVTGSGRPEPALTAALSEAGGIRNMPKELTPEQKDRLVHAIRSQGDPAIGEAIFRRGELACFKCHAIGGQGGKVGPDLISIGASAQMDYLIDSLLLPSKNVKEGYQTLVVLTDEGKLISGIKVRQSDRDLILRDANDVEVAIPLSSIDEQQSGSSLMPAGLTDKLTQTELTHLVRFLSELGKPGPYAIDPAVAVVRSWKGLQPDDTSWQRLTRTSDAQAMADDSGLTWVPIFTTVDGSLPVHDIPSFGTPDQPSRQGRAVAFVRTSFNVTAGGQLDLDWGDVSGLQVWVDGQPGELKERTSWPVTPGTHVLSIAIDLRARKSPLKLVVTPTTTARLASSVATP